MYSHSPKALAMLVVLQRKKLGLSQSAVAKRVGLRQQTISAFENNPESTLVETLFRILSAVNLNMELQPKGENKNKDQWQEGW